MVIDERALWLRGRGSKIDSGPREYDYTPGHYAVFSSPDSIKLDLLHRPRTVENACFRASVYANPEALVLPGQAVVSTDAHHPDETQSSATTAAGLPLFPDYAGADNSRAPRSDVVRSGRLVGTLETTASRRMR
ncbi:MAG: hypothetical protein ABR583_11645 [Gaiellaceae bacterium]